MRRKLNDAAAQQIPVYFVDEADGKTPVNNPTDPIVYLRKNGGDEAEAAGAIALTGEHGWHWWGPNAVDLDTIGPVAAVAVADGCDPFPFTFEVHALSDAEVDAKIARIGTAGGLVQGPAGDDAEGNPNLTLRIRDDYTDENGQPIEIVLPADWPSIATVPLAQIKLGFGQTYPGTPTVEIVATGKTIVGSVQTVKFEPREASTTLLPPGDDWIATCLVEYDPGAANRRSFNLTLHVDRSYVS